MVRNYMTHWLSVIALFVQAPRQEQEETTTGNREGGKHKTGRAKTLEPSAGNHEITLECNALCSMLPREGPHDKLQCDHSVTRALTDKGSKQESHARGVPFMGGLRIQESATANHQRNLLGAEHKPRASLRAPLPNPTLGIVTLSDRQRGQLRCPLSLPSRWTSEEGYPRSPPSYMPRGVRGG